LEYRLLGGDPTGILFEPEAQNALKKGSIFQIATMTEKWDKKFNKEEILDSYIEAAVGAELIITAGLTLTASYCVAEKLKVPWVPIILGPTLATSEFPIWPLESIAICSCLNKWTYSFLFRMLWSQESKFINPWRIRLGLSPITTSAGIADLLNTVAPPIIIACSKLIIGKKGEVPHDYPNNAYVPGFFFVPRTNIDSIDPYLREFIEDNPRNMRTIYLGFGSMPAPNPLELLQMAVDVCHTMVCRAIVLAGWSVLDTDECQEIITPAVMNRQLMIVKAAPHDWLFSEMDCIVHHCGVSIQSYHPEF
jgi:sterol 3beta-glucosyltransferase